MKKALVLALTVLMVLSLATAAFAAELSYSGKVAVKFSGATQGDEKNDPLFEQDAKEAQFKLDYKKDYGDGVTAGVISRIRWHESDEVDFDGAGWVKLDRDLFTLKAATGIDGGAGKDLKRFTIDEKPGLGLDLKLIEGLTVNTVVNGGGKDGNNFLVKGEYAHDLFTLGAGYQSSLGVGNFDSSTPAAGAKQSAIGVFGSANLIDGLTLKGEYGSRDLNTKTDDDSATAIFANAAYTLDALTAKAGFLSQDIAFGTSVSKDDVDNEEWRINEHLRAHEFAKRETGIGDKFGTSTKVAVLFADASYQLTEEFSVGGYVDYLLSAKDANDNDVDDLDTISYKAGVTYKLDAVKLEGWYKGYGRSNAGGKVTYTLADGVDASLDVNYTIYKEVAGVKPDGKLAYTAKITATL